MSTATPALFPHGAEKAALTVETSNNLFSSNSASTIVFNGMKMVSAQIYPGHSKLTDVDFPPLVQVTRQRQAEAGKWVIAKDADGTTNESVPFDLLSLLYLTNARLSDCLRLCLV